MRLKWSTAVRGSHRPETTTAGLIACMLEAARLISDRDADSGVVNAYGTNTVWAAAELDGGKPRSWRW